MDKTISKIIDFIRFPMACAVVLLHTPGKYTNWSHYTLDDLKYFSLYDHMSLISNIICQIAVPIFFLISGYLFYNKEKSYTQKLRKRTKTILMPYFIWNGITFFLMILIKILGIYINHKPISGFLEYITPINILKYFIGNFENSFTWQPIDSPLWFIRDLYIMFLLYPILHLILHHLKSIIVIISAIYICNIWSGFPCLQFQTLYFFSIGIYLKMYDINILEKIEHYKIIISSIVIISFILRYLTGNRIFMPTFILTFSCLTIYLVSQLKIKKFFTYVQMLKKYSFFIFAIHIIIIERLWAILYHPCLSKIEWIHCLSYIINPIIIIIICLFLYKFLEKTYPKFLSIATGTRANPLIKIE